MLLLKVLLLLLKALLVLLKEWLTVEGVSSPDAPSHSQEGTPDGGSPAVLPALGPALARSSGTDSRVPSPVPPGHSRVTCDWPVPATL